MPKYMKIRQEPIDEDGLACPNCHETSMTIISIEDEEFFYRDDLRVIYRCDGCGAELVVWFAPYQIDWCPEEIK